MVSKIAFIACIILGLVILRKMSNIFFKNSHYIENVYDLMVSAFCALAFWLISTNLL